MCVSVRGSDSYRITERIIPTGFEREARLLEMLTWPKEPVSGYNAKNAPKWDLHSVAPYISSRGIEFTDVNHAHEGRVSREQILRQLAARKGLAFDVFSHLSHIYSIPYKQYSELRFSSRDRSGGCVVGVGDWYRLTFVQKGGSPVLVRVDYQMREGE
jgi:hypothetical protein